MEEGEELDDHDEAVVDMADDDDVADVADDDDDNDEEDDGYIVTADGLATMINATTSRGGRSSTGANSPFLSIAMHPINTTTTYQQGLSSHTLTFTHSNP